MEKNLLVFSLFRKKFSVFNETWLLCFLKERSLFMNKGVVFKIIGVILAAAGAIVASKSNDIELERLVEKKLKEKEQ